MKLPCDACNGDGFVSYGDRHIENRKESCATCGGTGEIEARTGERPESSAPLAIPLAMRATPAPSSPGVPDSVRALSEAASPDWDTNEATPYILGPPIDGEIDRFEVIARGSHGHAKSGDAIRKWQANRMFAVAAVNFVRTLIAAQPAGQAGDAGADARTVMTEACKPWEHYTGEPPDDGSPLSGVFVAGMVYTERLLAKLLDVTHYEGGDGSEDFDNDATQTLRNILTGAGLWDADENRAVKPAPDSTRTGSVGTEEPVEDAASVRDALHKAVSKVLHDNQFFDDWNELVDPVVDAALAARPEAPVPPTPVIDVQRMGLSSGKADYFVRIRCGGREQTLFKLSHRHQAQYTADELCWLLGLREEKPELLAYDHTTHPDD